VKIPPYIVDVRVAEAGRHRFRLWLPMFLLWPLLLVLGILALVVMIVVDSVLFIAGRRHRYTALLFGLLDALGETRGLEIFFNDKTRTVDVTIR
jgi:hypothetical protein